jgi:hypothetical protein
MYAAARFLELMDRYDASQPGFKHLMLGVSDATQGTDYHLIVLPDRPGVDPLSGVRYVVERGRGAITLDDGPAIPCKGTPP